MNVHSQPSQPSRATELAVATTFDAASGHFDAEPLSFWALHGENAVARLGLRGGESLLDVGCGTGASLLPAAAAVGPRGRVVGVDISPAMLEQARHKLESSGITNVELECRDMMLEGDSPTRYRSVHSRYDAVLSIFSLFFVDDMDACARRLWNQVGVDGRLMVVTWAAEAFEPCSRILTQEISRLRPGWQEPQRPWRRLKEPEAVNRLLNSAGARRVNLHVENATLPLQSPGDWWQIVLGSGYRNEIADLAPQELERLESALAERINREGISEIDISAIYAEAS